MIEISYEPDLTDLGDGYAVQRVTLRDGTEVIGSACWSVEGDGEGVAQLVSLVVEPARRRRGHGHTLLDAVVEQLKRYHQHRCLRPRRLWAMVRQKDHIHARAFLTAGGFHHVATVKNLYGDQDALVYQRAFD